MNLSFKFIKKISTSYIGVPSTSIEKVVFFELKNKKYFAKDGTEITTEMLKKYPHHISSNTGYIKIN